MFAAVLFFGGWREQIGVTKCGNLAQNLRLYTRGGWRAGLIHFLGLKWGPFLHVTQIVVRSLATLSKNRNQHATVNQNILKKKIELLKIFENDSKTTRLSLHDINPIRRGHWPKSLLIPFGLIVNLHCWYCHSFVYFQFVPLALLAPVGSTLSKTCHRCTKLV